MSVPGWPGRIWVSLGSGCFPSAQERMLHADVTHASPQRMHNAIRTTEQRLPGGQHTHTHLSQHTLSLLSCRSLHARPSASGSSGHTGMLLLVTSKAGR